MQLVRRIATRLLLALIVSAISAEPFLQIAAQFVEGRAMNAGKSRWAFDLEQTPDSPLPLVVVRPDASGAPAPSRT